MEELFEKLLTRYEKIFSENILFFSGDKVRDYKLLGAELKSYREQFKLLNDRAGNLPEAGEGVRKENIQGELL